MAFFKYLIIFIAVAWLLPKVFKFFFRMFLLIIGKKIQKEMVKQAEQQQAGYPNAQMAPEGEIKVHKPSANSDKSFDGGDYVEYEEVKE